MSKAIAAMLCITAIVLTGMALGIDGYLYGLGLVALSGLGGYTVRRGADHIQENKHRKS